MDHVVLLVDEDELEFSGDDKGELLNHKGIRRA
jgi:hypothetical protein